MRYKYLSIIHDLPLFENQETVFPYPVPAFLPTVITDGGTIISVFLAVRGSQNILS